MKYCLLILLVHFYYFTFSQDTILYINEILSSNENINKDRNNDYSDWVEIYNPNSFSVNLGGMYISTNENNLKQCLIENLMPGVTTIQAGTCKIIWCNNIQSKLPLHINLKLSSKGETIFLVNKDGKTIYDKVTYDSQRIDISYGRFPDGKSNFFYFLNPTPEKPNLESKAYTGICQNPKLSKSGGFYNESITVELDIAENVKVYYSTDGTIPLENVGILYNKPIRIDSTTVLRMKSYETGKIPSTLFSQTYFINEKTTFPVASLTTNDFNMFTNIDPKINIYKEKPINIEFFDANKEPIFNTLAGFRMVGKAIRNYPQKSYSIRFRSSYGISNVNYNFFKLKPKSKYFSLLLRNSGNDCAYTMFKDALLHTLVMKNTNIDCQGYQPILVFINGKYWGISNLREKINKYYITSNHKNIDSENIDMIEWGSKPIHGDNIHFNNLLNFIKSNDLKIDANFDTIKTMIDIDNFIDYQIAEIFYANTDWPMANMKYWRPRTNEGKWRWIMFDTDLAFDKNKIRCKGHHNTLDYAVGINNCHLPHLEKSLFESTIILRKLIENEAFKTIFINRFCDLMNTIFKTDNILSKINELKSVLEPEIDRHISRWGKNGGIPSRASWYNNIAKFETFAKERPDTMRMFINDKFSLGGAKSLVFDISENTKGKIKINTITPDIYPFNAMYFNTLAIHIEAISNTGYKFVEWSDGNKSNPRKILPKDFNSLTAIFD